MRPSFEWHVGDVVRKLREERGWSQAELAKAAKIGRQAVIKVEKNDGGQRADNLKKVAQALGFSEPELYAMVPRRGGEAQETQRAPKTPDAAAGGDFPRRR
jgi:transcriptional regulator with XRE-family HTH domain